MSVKQQIIDSIKNNDFNQLDQFIDTNKISISTCLLKFMLRKNIEGLKYLITEREALNIKYNNINIMTLACQFDWIEGVQYLCQFDSLTNDTEQHSKYLINPLFSSIIYERPNLVEYLLNNEKQFIDVVVPDLNDNIVHISVSIDNVQILEKILTSLDVDNKYIINSKNAKGFTPLHLAVITNEVECVKCLIEHGADINIMDNTSKTPLELAHDEGYNDIYEYLRDKSGDDYFENIALN